MDFEIFLSTKKGKDDEKISKKVKVLHYIMNELFKVEAFCVCYDAYHRFFCLYTTYSLYHGI